MSVDVPMPRLPWANWGLILLTIVVSLAVPYTPGGRFHLLPELAHDVSPLCLHRPGFHASQLVTHLFQHAGLLHLLGNMLFLFVFGNAVNAKLGHLRFLAVYFAIGTAVGLAWVAVTHRGSCLGASGAIMGVCGVFAVLYPRNDVRVFWDELEIALIFQTWTGELPGWAVVLLFLLFDLWGAVFRQHDAVAYTSHIVGLFVGAGLAWVLLSAKVLETSRGEQTLPMWLAGEPPAGTEEDR